MSSTAWSPPSEPDPSAILDSAAHDMRAGLYEQALAKFLWFHRNAVGLEPSLSAVRLSFAIGYWSELASAYPPAREALIRTRDEAEAAFRADNSNFELFHELSALNERFGESTRTADLFEGVARKDHAAAVRLYHVAERSLIAAERYRACGPFLDPARRMNMAEDCYHMTKEYEESRPEFDIPIPKFAQRDYAQDVATLAALLVLNDRAEDAKSVYDTALRIVNGDDFRATMDAAMSGKMPNLAQG